MPSYSPAEVAAQYATERHLRTRIGTHERYSVGPGLEGTVDRLLALSGDEALLDVGMGPGDFPGRLRQEGHRGRIVGVDFSAGMVERASEQYPEVEFLQGDAAALPFADASFDVVTARHMLYHVPDVAAALAEFRRVLKPTGHFLAVTNASGYMAELWEAVAEALPGETILTELLSHRGGSEVFSEVHGEALVRAAFGNVQLDFVDGALAFDGPGPVLAYLESMSPMHRLTPDGLERIRAALTQVLTARTQGGEWRVSKRVVFISAQR
ncbi:class I SAM-dependent methyltransferase [Deinococcus marmoris]|uniref:2-heptaprenyl-1,4-naphthoquinone methyltransferase n=1 Tax=Deinococcus marmoris TaxID=249408 RepID=A0A1U7P4B2_9DEIO|nr:class I SAM-dependent methyltransferase [Deinococcus marmoris]OLV20003.1 2-heptaprenyl-1,4-naphthoquinone methyltransferase [Deinococcus marmoris]